LKKIIHIINSLGDGGAERNLFNLVSADKKNNLHEVIALSKKNKYSKLFKKQKITVLYFNFDSLLNCIKSIYKIFKYLKKNKPDLLSTWLVHSDIIGSLIGKLLNIKVIWNLRTGYLPFRYLKFRTYFLYVISRLFYNFLSDFIIINSTEVINFYKLKKNFKYIPNNINFDFINKNEKIKLKILSKSKITIGQVARYDFLKNNNFLIETMNYLVNKEKMNNIICLMVGKNIDNKNRQLNYKIKKYKLEKNVLLLGQVEKIFKVYNVLDIHILTSLSEGTPNTILESTYLKVHNIYPNLSNLKKIFGTNNCYKKGSIISLASKIKEYISKPKKYEILKNKNKKIVQCQFDIKNNIKLYNFVWDKILNDEKNFDIGK